MKKSIFLLLLFGNLLGFAQKVDWVNAPMNPIAFEYKKEHFNLKGDVYSYGKRDFSEEGNLIYEKTFSNGVHYLYKMDCSTQIQKEGITNSIARDI